jgi:hypothetical protein
VSNFLSFDQKANLQLNTQPVDFYPVLLPTGLQMNIGLQTVIENLYCALSTIKGSIYRARDKGTRLVESLFEQLDDTTVNNLINTLTNDLAISVINSQFTFTSTQLDITNKLLSFSLNVYYNGQLYNVNNTINMQTLQIF